MIPHLELLNRPWILKQLTEIAPKWLYPIPGPYYQLNIKEIYEKH
jgi:7,8-dihydro-6-hydroxymethylpterin-pyrophosphokinase